MTKQNQLAVKCPECGALTTVYIKGKSVKPTKFYDYKDVPLELVSDGKSKEVVCKNCSAELVLIPRGKFRVKPKTRKKNDN